MTVLEIMQRATLYGVFHALKRLYPEYRDAQISAHIVAGITMLNQKPIDPDGMYIEIHYVDDDEFSDDPYWAVSGKYPKDHKESKDWDGYWSIAFTPWGEWLPMNVVVNGPEELPVDTIAALLLYEATFYGFTPEVIRDKAKSIGIDSE